MTRPTTGVEKTYLLYFTALWLCGQFGWAAMDGLQPGAGCGSQLCCSGGASQPCCGPLASGNKCRPGECCSNPRCDECREVPECKEGEELHCSGTIDFSFICQECPPGTFSDGKTGCCVPWADCSRNGLQTVQQGNRTHNVQCGPLNVEPDPTFTTVLAILTAVGIFLLILMVFFLLVCMWAQKAAKISMTEDLEAVDPSKFLHPPQQRQDSVSCQYPEEERGHKMAEERGSTLFLAH